MPSADADTIAWVIATATASNDVEALVTGLAERLRTDGLPLWRLNIATPALDPLIRSASIAWIDDRPAAWTLMPHDSGEAMFERSPIFALMRDGLVAGRWRLDQGEGVATFPLLAELAAEGATDYLLRIVRFAEGTALLGTGISMTTRTRGGFSPSDLARIEALVPTLGLAVFRLGLGQAAGEVLSTYLGPMTGRRVLAGDVRRGQGSTIAAAILLADLAGFTALADRHRPQEVVAWLNEHLQAVGEAVTAGGGEILKFMGDGLLAVFPSAATGALPCAACAQALAAAVGAAAANAAVNARRRDIAEPELRVDLVLHHGDVFYGNVGTPRRLDFTTIGRAVNEASRIEKLCGALGHSLIVSDAFASRCDQVFVPLGDHALRGLSGTRTLWGLPDRAGAP